MSESNQTRPSFMQMGTVPEWVGAVVLVLGIFWGGFQFLTNVEQKVASLEAKQDAILQKLDSEQRIVKLELASALNEVNLRLSALEMKQEDYTVNFKQIWPRLRASDTNIRKLEQTIMQHHPDAKINLVDPQEF